MGFRLIREDSSEYSRAIDSRKKVQLREEAKRWSNITQDDKMEEKFLGRYEEVQEQDNEETDPEALAAKVKDEIRKKRASLAMTQGNIDIDRLMDLLE